MYKPREDRKQQSQELQKSEENEQSNSSQPSCPAAVLENEVSQSEDYSAQLSPHYSSEEDSNQTIQVTHRHLVMYHQQVGISDEEEQRVLSESALWSSDPQSEDYEEQIVQRREQTHQQEKHHQSTYTWVDIKEDQDLFVSLMKEYDELKIKVNQIERQPATLFCNGCGLLRNNRTRKMVNGVELQTYFCVQCDSKYEIIPK